MGKPPQYNLLTCRLTAIEVDSAFYPSWDWDGGMSISYLA